MYGDICSGKFFYDYLFICVAVLFWGRSEVLKEWQSPPNCFTGWVSLCSHAEPNCSVVCRYMENIFGLFCIAEGGVPALKTCFALHFTAEMWKVGIKGKRDSNLSCFSQHFF